MQNFPQKCQLSHRFWPQGFLESGRSLLSLQAKAAFNVDTLEESHPKGDGGVSGHGSYLPLEYNSVVMFCTAPQSSLAGLTPRLPRAIQLLFALLPSSLPLVASQMAVVVKNLSANAGGARNLGWIPGSGRSSGGGCGCPLQYSCLQNPMD